MQGRHLAQGITNNQPMRPAMMKKKNRWFNLLAAGLFAKMCRVLRVPCDLQPDTLVNSRAYKTSEPHGTASHACA